MKVKIEKIEPNPFRNINKYPINRDKIEELRNSIEETGFWGNVVVRPHNGNYQLAYGHHRFSTLKEIGESEMEVIIKDLDDSTMLKMMVNDNMDAYNTLPVNILENIRATRDFLKTKIDKYKTWQDLERDEKYFSSLFDGEKGFRSARGQGIGRAIIIKYLGRGWEKKSWMVQEALKTIDNPKFSEKAVEKLPTMKHLKSYTQAIEKENFSDEEQMSVVDEILAEDISSSGIARKVLEKKWQPLPKVEKKRENDLLTLDDVISDIRLYSNSLDEKIKAVESLMNELGPDLVINKLKSAMTTISLKRLYETLTNLLNNIKNEN